MIETLFKTMYQPLGIEPTFQYLPSRRGLQSANRFEVDAEAGRVLSVAKRYPNLIPINAPMIEHYVYLFCLEKQHCELSDDTLYAVVGGFQAGYQYCEQNGLDCLFEHSLSFMGQLLHNGAVDTLIGNKKLITENLCDGPVSRLYFRRLQDLSIVSYHLVNQQNQNLTDDLEDSILAMHQRGDFDAFSGFTHQTASPCKTEFVPLPQQQQ